MNIEATSDNADVALDTDSSPLTKRVVFTAQDWNTPQTITATVAGDDDAADDAATIGHARVSGLCGGGGFFGRPTIASVTVNVNDDETAAILLDADPSSPATDESGPLALDELSTSSDNAKSYTARLSAEPTADVTVAVTSGDTTAATVDKASLTFTSSNWNTRQTVTVTAVQDSDGIGENVTITHAASTTAMSEYTNVQATITASLTDKDAPGFVFDADPSSPATDEAGPLELQELSSSSTNAADYTVRLTSQPTQTVTATITSGDTSAVTVGQSTLTFTSSSWNTPQTVTLSAQQDDGGANESVTITHSAATTPNSEYTNVTSDFTATVDDDEDPGHHPLHDRPGGAGREQRRLHRAAGHGAGRRQRHGGHHRRRQRPDAEPDVADVHGGELEHGAVGARDRGERQRRHQTSRRCSPTPRAAANTTTRRTWS